MTDDALLRLVALLSLATSHRASASSRSAQLADAIRTVAAIRRSGTTTANGARWSNWLRRAGVGCGHPDSRGESWIDDTSGLPRADGPRAPESSSASAGANATVWSARGAGAPREGCC
jgi:hypothetical protein